MKKMLQGTSCLLVLVCAARIGAMDQSQIVKTHEAIRQEEIIDTMRRYAENHSSAEVAAYMQKLMDEVAAESAAITAPLVQSAYFNNNEERKLIVEVDQAATLSKSSSSSSLYESGDEHHDVLEESRSNNQVAAGNPFAAETPAVPGLHEQENNMLVDALKQEPAISLNPREQQFLATLKAQIIQDSERIMQTSDIINRLDIVEYEIVLADFVCAVGVLVKNYDAAVKAVGMARFLPRTLQSAFVTTSLTRAQQNLSQGIQRLVSEIKHVGNLGLASAQVDMYENGQITTIIGLAKAAFSEQPSMVSEVKARATALSSMTKAVVFTAVTAAFLFAGKETVKRLLRRAS